MKRLTLAVAIAAVLIHAGPASSATWGMPQLDRAASYVAGHDVHVVCEDDWRQWTAGTNVFGYTFAPSVTHNVFLGPRVCPFLKARLTHRPVLVMDVAIAMHILVHESTHQRGGIYADCVDGDSSCEGRTDCEALKHDEDVAVKFFGYRRLVPATVRQHGWVAPHTLILNPTLALVEWYQHQLHNHGLLPQYGGGCK